MDDADTPKRSYRLTVRTCCAHIEKGEVICVLVRHRLLLVALLAATTGSTMPTAASSAVTTRPAEVTFVQDIPSGPVNVYADSAVLINYFVFNTTIGPVPLKPGTWSIAIRPTTAGSTTRPMLYEKLLVTPDENASIVVNLSASGKPALSFFQNPTAAIAPGYARLTIRHLAAAPGVNLFAGTTRTGTDVTNGAQVVLNVPAGLHTIGVNFSGANTSALAPGNFSLSAGSTSILYVVGSATTRSLALIRQTH